MTCSQSLAAGTALSLLLLLVTFLVAGGDPTAHTLSFAVYEVVGLFLKYTLDPKDQC